MKIFYLDSFLILNLMVDYLLLILTAKLCGVPVRRSMVFFGAMIGTVFAGGMFFFTGGWMLGILLSISAAWVMTSVVFFETAMIKRLRLCGVFLLEAFGFSGCMSLLQNAGVGRIAVQNGIAYIQIEFWQIIASAVGAYFLFRLCFRDHSLKLEKQRILFRAELKEKKAETMLLVDSGNLLREPLSGNPVILLAPEIAGKLLPAEVSTLLNSPGWDTAAVMERLVEEGVTARVISMNTALENPCLTVAVKSDRITLEAKGNKKETNEYWIGIARRDIDVCGGCRGLIGV